MSCSENYSPEDNRYDHRQFLYHSRWPRQFSTIDALVPLMEQEESPSDSLTVAASASDSSSL
jgi:NAD+ synthase (glutamine-hydrolysing)